MSSSKLQFFHSISRITFHVNVTRHDTNFALARLDDSRAVRTDQSTFGLLAQNVFYLISWRFMKQFSRAPLSPKRFYFRIYPIIIHTLTMSCCGTPSVMHTIRGISAAMASMIACAAKGGGT